MHKKSISIAGHRTSISLEPVFWDALARFATTDGVSLPGLIGKIDSARVADDEITSLSSALRVYVAERLLHALENSETITKGETTRP